MQGASQIKREMAKRRIVIGINVRDRDLGGYVAELQKKVGKQVPLPAGYYYEWGGQFQNMERARTAPDDHRARSPSARFSSCCSCCSARCDSPR